MSLCRDGKPCETWFGADGSLICRHGLVSEPSGNTNVQWICPLAKMYENELNKWNKMEVGIKHE